jgi:cytosine/adenosine deaminase-related metal-dependent hydrolase
VGAPADLVVVDAENAAEAVAAHPPRIAVVRAGRVVRPPQWAAAC